MTLERWAALLTSAARPALAVSSSVSWSNLSTSPVGGTPCRRPGPDAGDAGVSPKVPAPGDR
ncbi:hypothetical protein [Dactylosporangium sp. NPDC048998]|uniref:hypothetical protein n=1 Tax=Dactylosporangium sp. NPDC048998 TaxID=3363976 RepID=UPI0037125C25